MADLEAGIGTLTRLADRGVDAVVVVVESSAKSLEVGTRIAALVREKSLGPMVIVANGVAGDDDVAAVTTRFPDEDVVAVPHDPAIVAADRAGEAPLDSAPDAPAVNALVTLARRLAPGR